MSSLSFSRCALIDADERPMRFQLGRAKIGMALLYSRSELFKRGTHVPNRHDRKCGDIPGPGVHRISDDPLERSAASLGGHRPQLRAGEEFHARSSCR